MPARASFIAAVSLGLIVACWACCGGVLCGTKLKNKKKEPNSHNTTVPQSVPVSFRFSKCALYFTKCRWDGKHTRAHTTHTQHTNTHTHEGTVGFRCVIPGALLTSKRGRQLIEEQWTLVEIFAASNPPVPVRPVAGVRAAALTVHARYGRSRTHGRARCAVAQSASGSSRRECVLWQHCRPGPGAVTVNLRGCDFL